MTEIEIRNYQSVGHAKFAIDGFTVIVGKNNIGKSAIIRAINAGLTNQQGDNFIREGQKSADVHVKRGDLDIVWKRGTSASYVVNGEAFSKLRGAVPQPLIDAGFKELQVGDEKINTMLAEQLGGEIFLLNKSGAFITEALSTMYNLDVLGAADDLCQKEQRSAKALLKTRESDLVALEEQLQRYADFEAVKKEIEALQQLDATYNQCQAEVSKIAEYRRALEDVAVRVKRLQQIVSVDIPETESCQKIVQESLWLADHAQRYQSLAQRVTLLDGVSSVDIPDCQEASQMLTEIQEIGRLSAELKQTGNRFKSHQEALKALEEIPDLEGMESLTSEVSDLSSLYTQLKVIADSVKQSKADMEQATIAAQKNQEELDKFDTCPLCLRPMNQGVHSHA